MKAVPAITEPSEVLAELRARTPARVALGRSGVSLPMREVLAFGLAHAQARDAVHAALDVTRLRAELEAEGWPVIELNSAAPTRAAYLARPDWGRRLDEASRSLLKATEGPFDLVFVVSDGLSALAVQRHAGPLLGALKAALSSAGASLLATPGLPSRASSLLQNSASIRVAPAVIATQARVALADEVGERLHARVAVSVIGERPGLSSPDSLGAYITAQPRVGRSDAERWCVSNIHSAGLSYADAAVQIAANIELGLATGISGVALNAHAINAKR